MRNKLQHLNLPSSSFRVKAGLALLAENVVEGCCTQGVALLVETQVEVCGNQSFFLLLILVLE